MRDLRMVALAGVSALILAACSTGNVKESLTKSGLNPEKFRSEYRGDSTALYTLTNANGMEVVLGFDSVQAYYPENNLSDFGAAIGRYANRINQGKFTLDGKEYQLPQNNFGHCLHGGTDMGTRGWQYRVYKVESSNDRTLASPAT